MQEQKIISIKFTIHIDKKIPQSQAEPWSSSSVRQGSENVGGEDPKDGEECDRHQQEYPEVQPDCAKHASPEVPGESCQGS